MTAFDSRIQLIQQNPLAYAALALVPTCKPEDRERIAVITAGGSDVCEVEMLGAQGISVKGFRFLWVDVREPERLSFFGESLGGTISVPVLIQSDYQVTGEDLTNCLKHLELIPRNAAVTELIDPAALGEADEADMFGVVQLIDPKSIGKKADEDDVF